MCDGYVCLVGKTRGVIRSRRIDICTDRYPQRTVESMSTMLQKKFHLDTSIVKRNNTYRIRIKQTSYNDFIALIAPYVVSSMRYKLYLGYETKPYWMYDDVWEIQKEIIECGYPTVNAEGIRYSLESFEGSARLKNPSQRVAPVYSAPSI